jgi:hypothetical protein
VSVYDRITGFVAVSVYVLETIVTVFPTQILERGGGAMTLKSQFEVLFIFLHPFRLKTPCKISET